MINSHLQLIDTEGLKAKAYKLPAPLRELKSLAKKVLSQQLSTVFEHVDDAFFDLADRAESNSEQTSYFDAMRMIRLERKAIEQKFLISMDQAFQQLGDVNYQGVSYNSSYDPEKTDGINLEVVENEDLEETIALGAMVSKVSQHEKLELKKIIARINFMVPADVVANSNPLGPEIICNALNDALELLEVDIRSRLVFFKLIDRHLIDGMGELLRSANEMLREMGVLPDLDKKQKQKGMRRQARRASDAASPAKQSISGAHFDEAGYDDRQSGAVDENEQFLAQLQGLLQQSELIAPTGAGTEPVALNDLVSLVSSLQGEWGEQQTSEQSLLGLIQGKLQNSGNAGLGARNQSVVHLLDQLFGRIRNEPGISKGIGQELRKLEMPMLRIALEDGSFFSKEKHPARQLLNQIAEASIGYSDDVDFNSDPVGKAIANVASILNKTESLDRDSLGKLLVNFMALMEKERRGSTAREQRIVEEVAAQEKVNQAKKLVDETLAERMQGKTLPQLFVTFAEDAWCKVMFLACLRNEKTPEDWQTSVQLLDELLDHAMKKDVVIEEVKSLIASVHQHLEDITFDPYELGCLIGGLEQYFYTEVGEQVEEPRASNEEVIDINKLPVEGTVEQTTTKAESKPQAPEALLKEVVVKKLKADIPGNIEEEEVREEPVDEEFLKVAGSLGRGSWVDFMDREPPNRRCKVAGIISPPGKYIFVNRQGAKVVEMNQNAVADGIKGENLVVVESVRMFDKALEQVIKGIRTNRQVH